MKGAEGRGQGDVPEGKACTKKKSENKGAHRREYTDAEWKQ